MLGPPALQVALHHWEALLQNQGLQFHTLAFTRTIVAVEYLSLGLNIQVYHDAINMCLRKK